MGPGEKVNRNKAGDIESVETSPTSKIVLDHKYDAHGNWVELSVREVDGDNRDGYPVGPVLKRTITYAE
jgi:hypothetical protein